MSITNSLIWANGFHYYAFLKTFFCCRRSCCRKTKTPFNGFLPVFSRFCCYYAFARTCFPVVFLFACICSLSSFFSYSCSCLLKLAKDKGNHKKIGNENGKENHKARRPEKTETEKEREKETEKEAKEEKDEEKEKEKET